MTDIICQTIIPAKTAIPEDSVVNTWAFTGTGSAVATSTLAADLLATFWGSTPTGGTNAVGKYIGASHNLNNAIIFKSYDLADPLPRAPAFTTVLGINPTPLSTSQLPAEVACCMSFAALVASGDQPARFRGRVYIGPLNITALATSTNTWSSPLTAMMTNIVAAGNDMMNAGDSDCSWGIYSRTDDVVRPVVRGWVDDAWDTQRRRGVEPTTRLTWS